MDLRQFALRVSPFHPGLAVPRLHIAGRIAQRAWGADDLGDDRVGDARCARLRRGAQRDPDLAAGLPSALTLLPKARRRMNGGGPR